MCTGKALRHCGNNYDHRLRILYTTLCWHKRRRERSQGFRLIWLEISFAFTKLRHKNYKKVNTNLPKWRILRWCGAEVCKFMEMNGYEALELMLDSFFTLTGDTVDEWSQRCRGTRSTWSQGPVQHRQQLWLMESKITVTIKLPIWLSVSEYLHCTQHGIHLIRNHAWWWWRRAKQVGGFYCNIILI